MRLLLPIARKKGLMRLHSDALVSIFAYNLVYANKFTPPNWMENTAAVRNIKPKIHQSLLPFRTVIYQSRESIYHIKIL